MFAVGIVIFFVSRWENHERHKENFLIFGYALYSIGMLGYYFVSNTYHLFVVEGVLGVAEAFNSPVFDGLYTKYLDKGKSVSEWGFYTSVVKIVGGVSAVVGGAIALYFGFKILFIIMFVVGLLGVYAAWQLKKVEKRKLRVHIRKRMKS